MQFWKRACVLVSLASAALLTIKCGKEDVAEKAPLSTLHTASYVGSGSVWNFSLNAAGTFTATKKTNASDTTAVLTLSGTYVTLSTGFYKFTVPTGGATGADAGTVTLPAEAYGFGVPNVVLMVKPIGSTNGEILVMPVVSSVCPTTALSFNWTEANTSDYGGSVDLLTKQLWGNAVIPATPGPITGKKFKLDGTVVDLGSTDTQTCVDGKIPLASGGFINITTGGVGIVKPQNGGSDGDIIALPRDSAVTIDALKSKDFVGLVFSEGNGTQPINLTFPASGAGTYSMLNNVETAAVGETGPLEVLEAGTGEKAGFLKLRANASTATNQPTMWAATVTNLGGSNRTFFFASGMNVPTAGGAATDSFSVIAIQK